MQQSFREIMELWPTVSAFASDVGVPMPTAAKWRQRDSVPAPFWASILATKPAKKSGVTADLLVNLAARNHK
jgi:hypothetical protein